MSDDDDKPTGKILSRREIFGLFGAAGAALLVACSGDSSSKGATSSGEVSAANSNGAAGSAAGTTTANTSASVPSCVVRPALTEGPYFVDEKLNRSDIRSDPSDSSVKPGVPLTITFNVSSMANNQCGALASAMINVWHCDALGVYSDASDPSFNTKGKKFLRGYQMTDAAGKATFTTIYPGWYQGRAVHVHFKIRSAGTAFTSQFFFDESLNDVVLAQAPYSQKPAANRLRNQSDDIYRQAGDQMILKPTKAGDGYAASFDVALQSHA